MKLSRRALLASAAVSLLPAHKAGAWVHGKAPSFTVGAVGGGGFVTGIRVSSDGTAQYLRNDTYAAWAKGQSGWFATLNSNVLTNGPMLLGGVLAGPSSIASNVYEIAVAPSDPNIAYMIGPGLIAGVSASLWKTTNKGLSWTQTTVQNIAGSYTSPDRLGGFRMVVDPANANVVTWGESTGNVRQVTDGGASGTTTTLISTAGKTFPCIVYDPTSGTTTIGGVTVTSGIYVGWFSGATHVQESRDGGQTWANTTGGPAAILYMKCSSDGVIVLTTGPAPTTNNAWRFATPSSTSGLTLSTWLNFGLSNYAVNVAWQSLCFSSAQAGLLILLANQGQVAVSENYGATFYPSILSSSQVPKVPSRTSSDIPWLAWTNANDGSCADIEIDPTDGQMIITNGIGVWKSPVIKAATVTSLTASVAAGVMTVTAVGANILAAGWEVQTTNIPAGTKITSQIGGTPGGVGTYNVTTTTAASASGNAGIPIAYTGYTLGQVGLIVTDIKKQPGDTGFLLGCEDRVVIRIEDVAQYPSKNWNPFGALTPSGTNIHHCFSVDYSKDTFGFWMLGVDSSENVINYSTDKGVTWNLVTGTPANGVEPQVAVGFGGLNTANAVICFVDGTPPQYTTDGGQTWANCKVGGVDLPSTGWGGFHGMRKIAVADDTTPGTFYLYNASNGFYVSTDGGATFTKNCVQTAPNFSQKTGSNAVLRQWPGLSGVLFYASGYYTTANPHPQSGYDLICTADFGVTWQIISSVDECWLVALGAAGPGKTAPTIDVVGYVGGSLVPGLFRSTGLIAPTVPTTNWKPTLSWSRVSSNPSSTCDKMNALWHDLQVFGDVYLGYHGYSKGTA